MLEKEYAIRDKVKSENLSHEDAIKLMDNLVDLHRHGMWQCIFDYDMSLCDAIEYEHQRLLALDRSKVCLKSPECLSVVGQHAFTCIDKQYEEPLLRHRVPNLIEIWKNNSTADVLKNLLEASKWHLDFNKRIMNEMIEKHGQDFGMNELYKEAENLDNLLKAAL